MSVKLRPIDCHEETGLSFGKCFDYTSLDVSHSGVNDCRLRKLSTINVSQKSNGATQLFEHQCRTQECGERIHGYAWTRIVNADLGECYHTLLDLHNSSHHENIEFNDDVINYCVIVAGKLVT